MTRPLLTLFAAPLLAAALAACSDKPKQQPAGSSGAFGVVNVDGRQKLYLPQTVTNDVGHGFVSVVDVGAAGKGVQGAPALIAEIDLGVVGEVATTTSGTSDLVVAASTRTATVWFIDPKADKVVGKLQLANAGQSSFSGGGGYVTGIAMDEENHRAILSVWNGFAIVDLGSRTVSKVIEAPPSENFGFDPVRQLIVAPFYDCDQSRGPDGTTPPSSCATPKGPSGNVMTAGLSVIKLGDGTVYTFQDPGAADPENPLDDEPDSAAVDTSTGVAVVPSEGSGAQNVIDLAKATFDAAKKTVTAPKRIVKPTTYFTGVSVEPTSHYAFFEEEGSEDVGLIQLSEANAGGGAFVHGVMPQLPDGSGWGNLGDPHGIAVSTGLSDGRAFGFVVDSGRKWVARVDLAKLASLPRAGSEVADMSASVTYLDARTKP